MLEACNAPCSYIPVPVGGTTDDKAVMAGSTGCYNTLNPKPHACWPQTEALSQIKICGSGLISLPCVTWRVRGTS